MTASIPVILNPAARSAQAASRVAAIQTLKPKPDVRLSKRPGDAGILAEELVEQGHPLIVAAGGDGTVNEVLQGLCRANDRMNPTQTRAALGVLPMGTMNVFSLEINQPADDLAVCWSRITNGQTREIDLWRANEKYFLQLAGVGADAEIIRQTTWEEKKRLGPLSYVLSAWRVIQRRQPTLQVLSADRPVGVGSLVLIGNGRHYGGPFRLFPEANPTDGLLDVLVFHQVGLWELAQLVRRVVTRGYSPSEDFEYFQTAEFTVTAERPVPVELDGELSGESPVRFRHAGHLLRVSG